MSSMTPQQFKKIARGLKALQGELEQEAYNEGWPVTSPEFEAAAQNARTFFVEREGFTIEEYNEAKAIIEEERTRPKFQTVVDKQDIRLYTQSLK